jgi:hypothetical protein
VRLVGYIRERAAPADADSAYAQSDRIRRLATDGGHTLVAVCQDVPRPGVEQSRDGYLALLGVVEAGEVDGVVVSSLTALSPDKISQEIAIWDLRRRGVTVLSADPEDVDALSKPSADRSRLMVQEVLARVDGYRDQLGRQAPPVAVEPLAPEVVIELLPPSKRASRP